METTVERLVQQIVSVEHTVTVPISVPVTVEVERLVPVEVPVERIVSVVSTVERVVERTKVVEVPIETCTDFEARKRKVRRMEPDSIESNVPLHVGANFDAELDLLQPLQISMVNWNRTH